MLLLTIYVLIALVFSFLCSIAEAVLLSITPAHIALLEKKKHPAAKLLRALKDDINKPLAAILTLNTIAHTVGAAGAGAQAQAVFGNEVITIASAVLTLLILVFSEIIPKTLGAHYWKALAPIVAYLLKGLIVLMYPFIKMSEFITRGISEGPRMTGFSREEFAAMAEVSAIEGQIEKQESAILKNLLRINNTRVQKIITPRTVIFSVPETNTIAEFFNEHGDIKFSRIPIYSGDDSEAITGFVLRSDLLLAHAKGENDAPLKNYSRQIQAIPETTTVDAALQNFISTNTHIMLVVDEYGGIEGLLSLEDLLETLLGLEIVDEGDKTEDMQELALRRAKEIQDKMVSSESKGSS